jgi:hypothetical protein
MLEQEVTAGEEALDKVLKLYTKDSKMNAMFNFSNMEIPAVSDNIQKQSLCPKKNGTPAAHPPDEAQPEETNEQPAVALVSTKQQNQAHRDALSV